MYFECFILWFMVCMQVLLLPPCEDHNASTLQKCTHVYLSYIFMNQAHDDCEGEQKAKIPSPAVNAEHHCCFVASVRTFPSQRFWTRRLCLAVMDFMEAKQARKGTMLAWKAP